MVNQQTRCHICGDAFGSHTEYYAIIAGNTSMIATKVICFCVTCFQEVAGDEYTKALAGETPPHPVVDPDTKRIDLKYNPLTDAIKTTACTACGATCVTDSTKNYRCKNCIAWNRKPNTTYSEARRTINASCSVCGGKWEVFSQYYYRCKGCSRTLERQ